MPKAQSITKLWLPAFKREYPDLETLTPDEFRKIVRTGDPESELWWRFSERVTQQARNVLTRKGVPTRVAEPDDIAQSVFRRLCQLREKEESKLDELLTSQDLWSFLLLLISAKVKDTKRKRYGTIKRRAEVGESAFLDDTEDTGVRHPMNWVAGDDPAPDAALIEQEERERLLGLLPNDLRETAAMWLSGRIQKDIANQLGVRRQTVAERLKRIVTHWRLCEFVNRDIGDDESVAKALNQLLSVLPEDSTRKVAKLYLQGFEPHQISKKLSIDEDLVDLEIDLIVAYWRDGVVNA